MERAVVLFVPRLAKWPQRCYIVGFVTEQVGRFLQLTDIAGQQHTELREKVVYVTCQKEDIS